MRQPFDDGDVNTSKARMSVNYPARVMLVASMNHSPSGDWFNASDMQGATNLQMQRYIGRIRGPLLDRIELQIEVEKVSFEELSQKKTRECSAEIRTRC